MKTTFFILFLVLFSFQSQSQARDIDEFGDCIKNACNGLKDEALVACIKGCADVIVARPLKMTMSYDKEMDAVQMLKSIESDPTGKCEISIGEYKECFNNKTLKSCSALAVRLKGVASFSIGEKCK